MNELSKISELQRSENTKTIRITEKNELLKGNVTGEYVRYKKYLEKIGKGRNFEHSHKEI